MTMIKVKCYFKNKKVLSKLFFNNYSWDLQNWFEARNHTVEAFLNVLIFKKVIIMFA